MTAARATAHPQLGARSSSRALEARGAQPVADDLWLLRGRPRHAFNVYVMGDVLVDAATRHDVRRILHQVDGLELRAHVLTHGHLDHTGASHEICRARGLPLLCGEGDVAAVESDGRADLAGKPWPVRLEHRLLAGPGHPVAATLRQGDQVAGFTVLEVLVTHPGIWRSGVPTTASWCSATCW